MSRERARAALRLEPTDANPEMEMIDNDELMRAAGLDPPSPSDMDLAWPKLSQRLGFDLVCHQHEMPAKGRYTRLGHAEWNTPWGIAPHADTVAEFRRVLERARAGVRPCARGLRRDQRRGKPGVGRGGRRGLHGPRRHRVDLGPVFAPAWYRRHLIPRYERIWRPLKERGIPVIHLCDGDYAALVDDIAAADADGFVFEPCVSLGMMTEKFGRTKALLGNADCRVLLSGDGDDVEREVRRCVDLGRGCPGWFMLMSNHIPNRVPRDNVRRYFDAFARLRGRSAGTGGAGAAGRARNIGGTSVQRARSTEPYQGSHQGARRKRNGPCPSA